jgi:hypothetical protein
MIFMLWSENAFLNSDMRMKVKMLSAYTSGKYYSGELLWHYSKFELSMLCIYSEIYLQLLKCLFGTNLSAQWVEHDDNQRTSSLSLNYTTATQSYEGFYSVCFQTPYRHLTDFVTSPTNKAQDKDEGYM